MKYIYGIFILLETAFIILCLTHVIIDLVFIFIFLGLMFLLALSSRSLSYLYYNKDDKITYSLIVIDFIIKVLSVLLCPIIFFNLKKLFIIINIIFILIMLILFLVIKKKIVINVSLPSLTPDKNSIKLSITIIIGYFSYLGSIVLIWFPNYTNIQSIYIFIIPLIITITTFIIFYTKLIKNYIDKKKSRKYIIIWTVLYFLDLSFFCLVKYVLSIETIISFFTVIGLMIMLPYYNSCAKIIRNQIIITAEHKN